MRTANLSETGGPASDPKGSIQEKTMPFQTLIVEDSADYRHLLHEELSACFPAMDIQEAEDGAAAAALIRKHAPDLIFMDIGLPGENGLELTKKIKARHPRVIVIVLTNYDLPEYREMALRCRADYFLSKSGTTRDSILALVATLVPALGLLEEKGVRTS
jgi:DNA-binding NarL/FixJ family response regulator